MPNFITLSSLFDPTFRERVRDANSIEQIINDDLVAAGHHPLTGAGEELEGWHPAHGSTSGLSLKVNTAKQVYICFNCGEAGDVFTWIMHVRGCTFVEALRFLADRTNIPWPSFDPAQQQHWQQLQQERHDLEELFRAAVEFFHQQLTQEHIDFCKEQWGLTLETVQQYKLGFAPTAPDALQQYLHRKLFAEDAIQKSGLVVQVGNRWHDFFQGRIVFPYWRDLPHALSGLPGTPLYFIGRRLDGTTPDVPWEQAKYRKQLVHGAKHPYVSPTVSNTYFYGEHALQGLKDRPVLVTEGVADCLVALQADMPAISPASVRFAKACYPRLLQLARRAQRLIICNDNEDNQAGMKGALATAGFLDREGVDVRLVTLPRPADVSKIDLADFLKHHLTEDFQSLCDQAASYLDAQLATYTASADGYTNCQTAQQFVTEVLRPCPDAQKALAFLRYRVKAYFRLRKPDIDDLVKAYHRQQRQQAHRRTAPDVRLADGPEDASDREGFFANVGDAEDLDGLAAGARRDDDARPPEVRYRATRYGLVWEKPTKDGPTDVQLTNFTAMITAEVTRDDGAETRKRFALAAMLKGQTYYLDIPEAQFVGMSWVTEHLGAQAIVMAGMTLKDHTRAAIQILSPHIEHRHVYEHTGWRVVNGERCYLHNGGAITAQGGRDDIRVELSGVLARYQLPVPPTGAARIAAITASLDLQALLPERGMFPVQGAVYLAPLRELLVTEPPDFTVWLHGRSGLFKSEVAALAQAHWGDFSRMTLPASFVATGNALERLTFATKDALLVCDDYFPARNRREADAMDQTAARLLRGVGNGSGRSRMRQDTTMRPDLPPRGVTLATGERLPDGHSTNARLFLLSLTPTAQDDIANRLAKAQECKAQYQLAMSAYIQWIAQHWDTLQDTLPQRFRELRQLAYAPGNHFRQPSQIAYLQLAWEVFTTFALEVGALDPDSRTALLQDAWEMLTTTARQQSQALQDEAPEHRFLALLADGFASKRAYLENLNGDCPADGDAWGWVRVTRHDRDGNAYHELQRPLQGTLLGHAGEDWLYLFPE
jgi:DNA primase catalytic core